MPYLVDTDWVIDHLANVPEAVRLLDRLAQEGIAISIITYMEAYQGVLRNPNPEEAQSKLGAFVDTVPVLPLSATVARRCARLRETLRKQGKRVNARALDLIIAATALEYDLTLVTRNTEDYADVPELKLYQPS
mgnify:CR=1 FL=1|jgi:predicted nucleic acid-binding protein